MKKLPVVFSFFGQDQLADKIQESCGYDRGQFTLHQYPDEEVVIKIETDVKDRIVIFIVNLVKPNNKILPLIFAAETARSLGASRIILMAPYLVYMRHDKVFEPGQGLTPKYFAKLISSYFDSLITIDPHLHRFHRLDAIYTIPTYVLHAAGDIAQWIHQSIEKPLLIGPDMESMQWVAGVAKEYSLPFVILEKVRIDDTTIKISIPDIHLYQGMTPVLVDDIISTGMTMIETINHLHTLNMPLAVCVGVHAVFSGNAYQKLLDADVKTIVTCNTIPHPSNGIDLSQGMIDCLLKMLESY
jgi:ribose-phosphate pyrophosphokinase